MLALAVVFVVRYAIAVIGNLQGRDALPIEIALVAVWAAFAVDHVVRLVLAEPRRRWFVRPLQSWRSWCCRSSTRSDSSASSRPSPCWWAFRGRVTLYVVASASLLVLIAGLAVLDAEQNAEGANITNFADAIWWAFVTITTVGYGDFYPVTSAGRLIAVGLMIAGICAHQFRHSDLRIVVRRADRASASSRDRRRSRRGKGMTEGGDPQVAALPRSATRRRRVPRR